MDAKTHSILQKMDGKTVKFAEILLFCEEGNLMLHADLLCENEAVSLLFTNVSSLSLKAGIHRFEMTSFSFTDKQKDGYESDVRYYIEDDERDTLSFYCCDVTCL